MIRLVAAHYSGARGEVCCAWQHSCFSYDHLMCISFKSSFIVTFRNELLRRLDFKLPSHFKTIIINNRRPMQEWSKWHFCHFEKNAFESLSSLQNSVLSCMCIIAFCYLTNIMLNITRHLLWENCFCFCRYLVMKLSDHVLTPLLCHVFIQCKSGVLACTKCKIKINSTALHCCKLYFFTRAK